MKTPDVAAMAERYAAKAWCPPNNPHGRTQKYCDDCITMAYLAGFRAARRSEKKKGKQSDSIAAEKGKVP